ncbi:hypothetical protein [Celeribacter marinus]|nr:hypothetical protein [Celeribacter marinus]SFK51285.1 hypothetical protein SAMN05444421_10547 [Celeribacter marinus]
MSRKDTRRDQGPNPSLRLRISDFLPDFSAGLPMGTKIMTADGALPVEYLEPGDRIITRSGMKVLRGIDTPAPHRFQLTFDRVEVIYADGLQIKTDTGEAIAA